jgi:hypothetical protein
MDTSWPHATLPSVLIAENATSLAHTVCTSEVSSASTVAPGLLPWPAWPYTTNDPPSVNAAKALLLPTTFCIGQRSESLAVAHHSLRSAAQPQFIVRVL